MNELRVMSLNAAAYISSKTGVKADLDSSGGNKACFIFPNEELVEKEYNRYRRNVGNQTKLYVDIITYNNYIRDYKKETYKFKRELGIR